MARAKTLTPVLKRARTDREHPAAPPGSAPAVISVSPTPVERPEESETVLLAARVPAQMRRDIKRYGVEVGKSVQTIVNEAMAEYLARVLGRGPSSS